MTQYVGKGLTLLRHSQSKKANYSLKNRWKWREKVTWSVKWRERVAPQPQAAGNTGRAWQRGRAITSSTILLGTVCLKRKSEKGPKSRFRQTPSGSTSTNKYEPLPTNWFVWNANPKKVRNRVSDKPRLRLSETQIWDFCELRFRQTMFRWNGNCLKRDPTKFKTWERFGGWQIQGKY